MVSRVLRVERPRQQRAWERDRRVAVSVYFARAVQDLLGLIVSLLLAIVLIEILVRLVSRYLPRKPKN